jgi:thiamine transport system permease protein
MVLGPLIVLIPMADQNFIVSDSDWAALKFTIFQATCSSFLSVLIGWPLARALARQNFKGKQFLILLFGAPFILPVLVAILGLLSVFGHKGLVNLALSAVGLDPLSIYGLQGILLAHIYFNVPLATRLIYQGLASIPQERWRLGSALSLTSLTRFRIIEWPIIRRIAPQAFGAIFVICLTSFAIVLTLGGGPRSTTIEVAIYQAIRFDLNFAKAAVLGLSQFVLAGITVILAVWVLGNAPSLSGGVDRSNNFQEISTKAHFLDWSVIIIIGLFLTLPLGMIFFKGLGHFFSLGPEIWLAAFYSIMMALTSTSICIALSCALSYKWGEVVGTLAIATSPLVMGAGLFLMIRKFDNPFDHALLVTILVNAVMGLPFAIRIIRPAAEDIRHNYARLSKSLSLTSMAWTYWVFLPRLRKPLGYAGGLVAALSMGDLGIIALFGGSDFATLPLKIYQLMGAYRMDQALSSAVLLVLLSFSLFFIFDYLGNRRNV